MIEGAHTTRPAYCAFPGALHDRATDDAPRDTSVIASGDASSDLAVRAPCMAPCDFYTQTSRPPTRDPPSSTDPLCSHIHYIYITTHHVKNSANTALQGRQTPETACVQSTPAQAAPSVAGCPPLAVARAWRLTSRVTNRSRGRGVRRASR